MGTRQFTMNSVLFMVFCALFMCCLNFSTNANAQQEQEQESNTTTITCDDPNKIPFLSWLETHWETVRQCRSCNEINDMIDEEEEMLQDLHATPCSADADCGFGVRNLNIRSQCAAGVRADKSAIWNTRQQYYNSMFPQQSAELQAFLALCGRPHTNCAATDAYCVRGRCLHFQGPPLPPGWPN